MTIITILAPAVEETIAAPSLSHRAIARYYVSGEIGNIKDRLPGINLPARDPIIQDRSFILDSVVRKRLGTLEH